MALSVERVFMGPDCELGGPLKMSWVYDPGCVLPSGFSTQLGILRLYGIGATAAGSLRRITDPFLVERVSRDQRQVPVVVVRKIAKSQSQRVSQLWDDPYQAP